MPLTVTSDYARAQSDKYASPVQSAGVMDVNRHVAVRRGEAITRMIPGHIPGWPQRGRDIVPWLGSGAMRSGRSWTGSLLGTKGGRAVGSHQKLAFLAALSLP